MLGIARNTLLADIEEVRRSWGWYLALGILFMVIGAICIASDVMARFTTFAAVLFFGFMLLFSGVMALIHAFGTRSWSGFFLSLLSALLRGFTGYLLIRYPGFGAVTLTLVLASFFVVGGLFRAGTASMMQFPRWGWAAFSGIISLLLGILLLVRLPTASVWFIGFAIGVDLILDGAALVGFATAVHGRPPAYTAAQPA